MICEIKDAYGTLLSHIGAGTNTHNMQSAYGTSHIMGQNVHFAYGKTAFVPAPLGTTKQNGKISLIKFMLIDKLK